MTPTINISTPSSKIYSSGSITMNNSVRSRLYLKSWLDHLHQEDQIQTHTVNLDHTTVSNRCNSLSTHPPRCVSVTSGSSFWDFLWQTRWFTSAIYSSSALESQPYISTEMGAFTSSLFNSSKVTVQITLSRKLQHLLPNLNASKGIQAVKLCTNKIIQFLTEGDG